MKEFSITGRLTKDPELKELENGSKVCNVTVARDRKYKNKDGNKITDFHNIALWDKNAENFCKICKKGSMVNIEGYLGTKEIETTNGKISVPSLVVNSFTFLSHANNYDNEVEQEKEQEMVK